MRVDSDRVRIVWVEDVVIEVTHLEVVAKFCTLDVGRLVARQSNRLRGARVGAPPTVLRRALLGHHHFACRAVGQDVAVARIVEGLVIGANPKRGKIHRIGCSFLLADLFRALDELGQRCVDDKVSVFFFKAYAFFDEFANTLGHRFVGLGVPRFREENIERTLGKTHVKIPVCLWREDRENTRRLVRRDAISLGEFDRDALSAHVPLDGHRLHVFRREISVVEQIALHEVDDVFSSVNDAPKEFFHVRDRLLPRLIV